MKKQIIPKKKTDKMRKSISPMQCRGCGRIVHKKILVAGLCPACLPATTKTDYDDPVRQTT